MQCFKKNLHSQPKISMIQLFFEEPKRGTKHIFAHLYKFSHNLDVIASSVCQYFHLIKRLLRSSENLGMSFKSCRWKDQQSPSLHKSMCLISKFMLFARQQNVSRFSTHQIYSCVFSYPTIYLLSQNIELQCFKP